MKKTKRKKKGERKGECLWSLNLFSKFFANVSRNRYTAVFDCFFCMKKIVFAFSFAASVFVMLAQFVKIVLYYHVMKYKFVLILKNCNCGKNVNERIHTTSSQIASRKVTEVTCLPELDQQVAYQERIIMGIV